MAWMACTQDVVHFIRFGLMNGEVSELENEADEFEADVMAETAVLPEVEVTDNVGDASVEINVEELIADIEKSNDKASARQIEVRRRLEELAESRSMEDTFAIEFD